MQAACCIQGGFQRPGLSSKGDKHQAIQPGRGPPGYLRDKLGAETVDWVHNGKPVVIAMGEGQKTLKRVQAAGWELGTPVKKPVDYHLQQVRHARNAQGEEVLLVWRVNGQDRTDHLQSSCAWPELRRPPLGCLPPLYGDMSRDLLDALLEHGVKKINSITRPQGSKRPGGAV